MPRYKIVLASNRNISDFNSFSDIIISKKKWIIDGHVFEFTSSHLPKSFQPLDEMEIDYAYNEVGNFNKFTLFFADMDATIIEDESLDEIARQLNCNINMKQITKQAMAGKIDFRSSLKARVAKLVGFHKSVIEDYLELITITDGAKELIENLKRRNIRCVLVSGGFTEIASFVAKKVGFDCYHANQFEYSKDSKFLGTVAEPILDGAMKLSIIENYCKKNNCSLSQTIAIGDGANDIDMIKAVGLGCGYRPKTELLKAAKFSIKYNNIDILMHYLNLFEKE